MTSQQPRPPWFRFSSVASRAPAPPPPRPLPPAPPRAPAPAPVRPSFPVRPTQTQEPIPPPPPPPPAPQPSQRTPASSSARSPVPQPARPSPPPAPPLETKSSPTSPIQKEVSTTSSYAPLVADGKVNGKATPPLSSPKTIKPIERTPAESPELRTLSRPPSPLTLPPAQLDSDQPMMEQKTMLVQQNTDKPLKMPRAHNNVIASNGKGEPTSKHKKLISDSEELGIKVITLAGDNKGSVMGFSPQSLHKNKVTESESSNGEGKSRNKDHANGGTTMQSYFNSNVQGLNNSIVYNTTFRNNDPGIHLSLRKLNSGRSKD